MARKSLSVSKSFPYHVTARSNNREWFALAPAQCWHIFSDYLYGMSKIYDAQIHAFVLMSNHFHLILSLPEFEIGLVMNRFMSDVSSAINFDSRRTNHVFGGRYKGCLITEPYYFANAMKYVYRNPVVAGLVKRVEDYDFSSLHGLTGQSQLTIPIVTCSDFDKMMPADLSERLEWLNQSFENAHSTQIRRSLQRTEFSALAKRTSDRRFLLRASLC